MSQRNLIKDSAWTQKKQQAARKYNSSSSSSSSSSSEQDSSSSDSQTDYQIKQSQSNKRFKLNNPSKPQKKKLNKQFSPIRKDTSNQKQLSQETQLDVEQSKDQMQIEQVTQAQNQLPLGQIQAENQQLQLQQQDFVNQFQLTAASLFNFQVPQFMNGGNFPMLGLGDSFTSATQNMMGLPFNFPIQQFDGTIQQQNYEPFKDVMSVPHKQAATDYLIENHASNTSLKSSKRKHGSISKSKKSLSQSAVKSSKSKASKTKQSQSKNLIAQRIKIEEVVEETKEQLTKPHSLLGQVNSGPSSKDQKPSFEEDSGTSTDEEIEDPKEDKQVSSSQKKRDKKQGWKSKSKVKVHCKICTISVCRTSMKRHLSLVHKINTKSTAETTSYMISEQDFKQNGGLQIKSEAVEDAAPLQNSNTRVVIFSQSHRENENPKSAGFSQENRSHFKTNVGDEKLNRYIEECRAELLAKGQIKVQSEFDQIEDSRANLKNPSKNKAKKQTRKQKSNSLDIQNEVPRKEKSKDKEQNDLNEEQIKNYLYKFANNNNDQNQSGQA